jgi:hypothetical protein
VKVLIVVNIFICDIVLLFAIGFSSLFMTPVNASEAYFSSGRIFFGVLPMLLSLLTAMACLFLWRRENRSSIKR